MGKQFKVVSLKVCAICAGDLPKRSRRYCSKQCRNKAYGQKYKKYRSAFQLARYDREASKPGNGKIQCQICKKFYRMVGGHIRNRHEMTAREYREEYGFDVKRGQLPQDLRELKANQCIENGTVNNLKKGKKFRFKQNSLIAGRYIRSEETKQRLKELHKLTKQYEKRQK